MNDLQRLKLSGAATTGHCLFCPQAVDLSYQLATLRLTQLLCLHLTVAKHTAWLMRCTAATAAHLPLHMLLICYGAFRHTPSVLQGCLPRATALAPASLWRMLEQLSAPDVHSTGLPAALLFWHLQSPDQLSQLRGSPASLAHPLRPWIGNLGHAQPHASR